MHAYDQESGSDVTERKLYVCALWPFTEALEDNPTQMFRDGVHVSSRWHHQRPLAACSQHIV